MKNENKSAIEHKKEICRKCDHTRDEHYGAKHISKDPNYLYGSCSKCDCKSFEPKKLTLQG